MIINNCKKLYRSIMLSGGSNSSNSSSGNSSQISNNSNRINDNNNIISNSSNSNNNNNNNSGSIGSGYNNNNNSNINNIKQQSSVICKEVFDDGYQPSQEEINDYAIKIGIDPEKEPHLLYLAKDGLMQALPRDWQICYNEKVRAYYYYNTKSKVSQWDHPLDAEYKYLVDTARKQYNSNDLSEDASQIDSGIRSLQGNEDSELLTDISPMISYNKMENSLNGNGGIGAGGTGGTVGGGGGMPINKFLLPIDKIKTGSNEFNNEPNNNKYDVIRNKRFEVTNYTNSSQPPPQIGLSLKTDNNYGTGSYGTTGDSLIKNHEKTNNGDATIKGFTLTGTGSMFLKSNTSGGTGIGYASGTASEYGSGTASGSGSGSGYKSSSSTVVNFKKPSSILQNDNNSINIIGTENGTGTGNVKGILRDSSLTDVRHKIKYDVKSTDSENEERRMVRFNLQPTQIRKKDNFPKKLSNEVSCDADEEDDDDDDDDDEDDDYEEEEVAVVNEVNDAENNDNFNNEFDDDNDGWDFPIENTNANEPNVIDTINANGVQKIKLTLNKNISSTSTIKPLIFKNHHHNLMPSSILKNNKDNIVSTGSGTAAAGTVNKPNLLKLFERQTESISQNTIKPLYENTDTESDRSYNDPEDRWRAIKLKLDEEEHNAMENMKIKMQERLDEFKQSLIHEQLDEETRIRDEMLRDLELKKYKMENELNDREITKNNNDRLSLIVQEENDKLEREKEDALKALRENIKMEIDRERDVLQKDKGTKCDQLSFENELELKELQSKLQMKFENIKFEIENENSNKLDEYRENLKLEFEETCKTISIEHKSSVELLQRNHNEILQDLERDLKSEEELLRKENATNLIQLRDKLNHELEMERNRMRETGESRLYEKLRCEKRLLEDKYRCLKEKYARLKAEVKLSVERRNRRREHQTNNVTTGSETTDLTNSNANKHHQSIGNSSMSVTVTPTEQHYGGVVGGCGNNTTTIGVGKPPTTPKLSAKFRDQNVHTDNNKTSDSQSGPIDKKFGMAAAKYLTHIQQYHDDTTSISQSDTTISNNYVQQRSNRYLPVLNSTILGDTGNSDSEAFRCNQESHFNTNNNNNNNNNNTNNNNNNVSRENGRQRKKVFTRMKSASTSRLNSNTRGGGANGLSSEQHQHLLRPCTPVENLRRQLQKLEDLEDQFPDNSLDTTYHLRYPFTDTTKDQKNVDGADSELEFFKHRIHLERDSVRRAKETLRTQRVNFRAKQQEIKHCHRNANNRHTIEQLFQEEKELTDMEVNLHRTRALLGEKVIRLRHLQESLNRAYEKEKRIDFLPNTTDKKYLGISLHNQVHHHQHHQVPSSQHLNPKDDVTTISDLSSHSSSGFSSTDFAGTETLQNQQLMLTKQRNNKDMYQESSEIVQNVEQLNAEIREIWEILSKRQAHGLPPPPTTSTTLYQQQHHHHQQQQHILGWPTNVMQSSITPPSTNTLNLTQQILPSQSITSATYLPQQLPSQSIPTLADRLETYRQLASNRSAISGGGGSGGVPSASISTIHNTNNNNNVSSNIVHTTMVPAAISSSLNPANTIVSAQSSMGGGGYTTSLVERTQEMRNWLRLAKNEHELLNNGQQTNL